jgi:hypothetical protein
MECMQHSGEERALVRLERRDDLSGAQVVLRQAARIEGDMHLSSGTSSHATKRGTSFYIGGEAHVAAQGNWAACGDNEDSFNGDLKVIRHVVPTGPSVPASTL